MVRSLTVSGVDEILKNFRALPRKLKAVQKRATRLALTPLNKATKQNAPKPGKKVWVEHKGQKVRFLEQGSTGALRKSIGPKTGQGKNGVVFGLVGIRKDFFITAWNPWVKKTVKVKPVRYAHLVENGFVQNIKGKKQKIRGRAFMRPAFDATKSTMESIVIATLRQELAKEKISQIAGGA